MSENLTPQTKTETYLAAISGDYTGELPEPVTRTHLYLERIARDGIESSAEIAAAHVGADGKAISLIDLERRIAALEAKT